MTKRAAMILAGLVAAAVLAGGGALAGRVAGSVPEGSTGVEPVVREVRRTVTVQRKAAAPSGSAVQVIALPQGAPAASAGEEYGDHEGEEREDEGYDGDHEDGSWGGWGSEEEHEDD